jgi:uncharacterized protein with HEPN domain
MQPEDEERLRHMLDAAKEALSFAHGQPKERLNSDRKLALALVKAIEIIGEAANNVTEETRTELRSVPWLDIIGMRHHLVHAYFDVDLNVLWKTLKEDLPPLIIALEVILGDSP